MLKSKYLTTPEKLAIVAAKEKCCPRRCKIFNLPETLCQLWLAIVAAIVAGKTGNCGCKRKMLPETLQNYQSARDVAKLFNANHNTVSRVYKRYKETNDVYRKPKSGRPRKTTEGHDQSIIDLVEQDPNKTATDVTEHAFRRFGLTISHSTAN